VVEQIAYHHFYEDVKKDKKQRVVWIAVEK
jgi:hypothetical protein